MHKLIAVLLVVLTTSIIGCAPKYTWENRDPTLNTDMAFAKDTSECVVQSEMAVQIPPRTPYPQNPAYMQSWVNNEVRVEKALKYQESIKESCMNGRGWFKHKVTN